MRKILKALVYSPLVLAAVFVAGIGVTPASWWAAYQPAPPAK
ncbi:MAG: cyclic lactone autoinducer peptide [Peptococcaceae bacterium]|nr:cyclic lactone autoinducer peptide [Peptococcaceae bacterium]